MVKATMLRIAVLRATVSRDVVLRTAMFGAAVLRATVSMVAMKEGFMSGKCYMMV